MSIKHTDVLGVKVSAIDMDEALTTVDTWVQTREPHYICVTGVHGVMESQDDPSLRDIHNRAGLVTPDGMPLVWASRWAGHEHVERVYGPDLMLALCAASQETGYRHFLYGGAEGVPELLAAELQAKYPHLNIVDVYSPPFRALTPEEDAAVIERIDASGADIVWVGLSTPKQERWMAAHVGRLKASVLIGVGAAFDFHAGLKPQAPRWMQRSGLEWLFRMLTEPKRLAGRYLRNNPRFIFLMLKSWLSQKKAMPASEVQVAPGEAEAWQQVPSEEILASTGYEGQGDGHTHAAAVPGEDAASAMAMPADRLA